MIGRCSKGSLFSCRRGGLAGPSSGVIGAIEKSSETDSTEISDVSSPISVTGVPIICANTQRHAKRTQSAKLVPRGEMENRFKPILLIQITILPPARVGKRAGSTFSSG